MKTIAIVCGGDTSEHDVSMRSAAGIESFLDKERYIIYKVEIHARHWEAILPDGSRSRVDRNDFTFDDGHGARVRPDFCYITIHGVPGENGILQGYLDRTGDAPGDGTSFAALSAPMPETLSRNVSGKSRRKR